MKKTWSILFCLILTIALTGCQSDTNSDGAQKMEGMEHLVEGNEYGYYFDIYSDISKGQVKDGFIAMEHSTDNLYFSVENAGEPRKMAVQIFIDYIQVPIVIEGEEYVTFFIDADESFSQEYSFVIGQEIDESVDHKIMAVLTASADRNAKDLGGDYTVNEYSIAYDEILDLKGNEDQTISDSTYDYEEPGESYEAMWYGLIINDDIKEFKRSLPPKEITAEAGAEIELQYHVGGYEDCQEVLMLLSLDMQQIQMNDQDYFRCKVEKGEIVSDTFTIKAPSEPGAYDLTGWVIKDPFSQEAPEFFPLDAAYRFTVNVCE